MQYARLGRQVSPPLLPTSSLPHTFMGCMHWPRFPDSRLVERCMHRLESPDSCLLEQSEAPCLGPWIFSFLFFSFFFEAAAPDRQRQVCL